MAQHGPARERGVIELVAPAPRTELTGGYRYNRRIAEALGAEMRYAPGEPALPAHDGPRVIDSLCFAPGFAAPGAGRRDILLAHSLPSLDPTAGRAEVAERARREAALALRFRGAIAPSRFMARTLVARGFRRGTVRVVPPGGCASAAGERAAAPGAGEPVRVVTVAAWHRGKGQDMLPGVMAACRGLPWSWTFIGHGAEEGYREGVLDELRRLGLLDRVRVIDAMDHDELRALLADSHLFVLPTRVESYGMAVREAVSAGTPAIVGRCGGTAEALAGSGVAVRPGNTAAWSRAVRRALADRAWLAVLGRRAASAPPPPTWEAVARDFAAAAMDIAG
jgi:glycosyltransferase involved in cell wall biosynthesis